MSQPHTGSHDNHESHGSLKSYIIGFALSIILTIIPLVAVMNHMLEENRHIGLDSYHGRSAIRCAIVLLHACERGRECTVEYHGADLWSCYSIDHRCRLDLDYDV